MTFKISNQQSRIEFIDVAKGIAIICVILGHCVIQGPSNDLVIYKIINSFHMPIFFIIIGYFINNKKPTNEFIKNKARTLLIPYIIISLLCVILGILSEQDFSYGFFRWFFAACYGSSLSPNYYIISIGPIWFLWAAFWGAIFLRVSLNFNHYLLRLLFIFTLFVIGKKYRTDFWLPFSIQIGACITLYMYIGYIFKENQIYFKLLYKNISSEIKIFVVFFGLMCWFLLLKDYNGFRVYSVYFGKGVDILGSLYACAIVLLLSKQVSDRTRYVSKFISYFGRYSLLVLCFHNLEWKFFPWNNVIDMVINFLGISFDYKLEIVMVIKVIFDLFIVFILSKIPQVRKLFGYKN